MFVLMEYLSKQRYDEIATELDYLINVVYPEVRENVEVRMPATAKQDAGKRRPSAVSVFCRRFWRIPV